MRFPLLFLFAACAPIPASATATREVIPSETALAPTPTATKPYLPWDHSILSPDGQYSARYLDPNADSTIGKQLIDIQQGDGLILYTVTYQGPNPITGPRPSLVLVGWSSDSAYVYFDYEFTPDGGDRAFWWDGYDFQRINVHTGKIEKVIDTEQQVSFAFSPDGAELVYARGQESPNRIRIRDLKTGHEKVARVVGPLSSYDIVGDFHWSPSGDELAYQSQSIDYDVQTVIMNSGTMKQKVVAKYVVHQRWFQGWT